MGHSLRYENHPSVSGYPTTDTKTTSLLTVEETDKALQKGADYRAPGR